MYDPRLQGVIDHAEPILFQTRQQHEIFYYIANQSKVENRKAHALLTRMGHAIIAITTYQKSHLAHIIQVFISKHLIKNQARVEIYIFWIKSSSGLCHLGVG